MKNDMEQPIALTKEEFVGQERQGAIIIDGREIQAFTEEGFQPGAIYGGKAFVQNGIKSAIPVETSLLLLADDKESVEKLTSLLSRAGYRSIAGYILTADWQSIPELQRDFIISVEPEELMIDMKYGDPGIIDMRRKMQYDKAHLEGAENISFRALLDGEADIPKNKIYYLYDEDGSRALSLISCLRRQGHYELYHVAGGYKACMDTELNSAAGAPDHDAASLN